MQIRLDLIEDEPFRWSETDSVATEPMDRPELLGLSPIEWSGSVAKAHPGYRLLADLEYRQKLACGRCLEPYEQTIESRIDLILMIRASEQTAGEIQLNSSDLGVMGLESELLDTDPILREQIELNLPMSVLCRPDCAGLCPHCGADRNVEPECCDGTEIDPRWQVLKDLEL